MSIFSLLPVEENLSFAVCSWGRLEKSYKTCTHQWWMKICRHISCVFRIETGLVIGSEPVCPGPPPFFLHMYRTNVGKEEKSRVARNEVGHRDVSNTNNKPLTMASMNLVRSHLRNLASRLVARGLSKPFNQITSATTIPLVDRYIHFNFKWWKYYIIRED